MDSFWTLGKDQPSGEQDFFISATGLHRLLENGQNMHLLDFSNQDSIQDFENLEILKEEVATFSRSFDAAHIPGAQRVRIKDIENENYNIRDFDELKEFVEKLGIKPDELVVVYGDSVETASYLAFILYYLGVDQVKILDGNFKNWEHQDYPVETGAGRINKESSVWPENQPKREGILLRTPDDLLDAQEKNPNLKIVSIRSWEEYLGTTSGYPYLEDDRNYEIAGALYGKTGPGNNIGYFLNESGQVSYRKDILQEWEESGITPDEKIAIYCGGGYRAAALFFILKQIDWNQVIVFQGGSIQWNKYHQQHPTKYPLQIGDQRSHNFKIIKERD